MKIEKLRQMNKSKIISILFFVSVMFANPTAQQIGTCGTAQVSQNLPTISNAHKIVTHDSDEVGDIVTFFVREDVFADPENVYFIEVEFVMKYGDEKLSIYAETEEWTNGTIDGNGISAIAETFLNSTPAEERGALEIEEEYFGDFPDVDSNGKLFVLIMDVNDGDDSGSYIAGYFDPSDQNGSSGNHADILFLDCAHEQFANSDYEAVLGTAVHELQHLIHHNYDTNEEIWLNEGLSEYAPRLCGFPQRSFSTFLANPSKSLTDWDGEIADYSRVSLFITYVTTRFGEQILADLVQCTEIDMVSVGISAAYYETGITEMDIFHDWILANLLNEPLGNFGYFGEEIPTLSPNIIHSKYPADSTIHVQKWSAQFIKLKDGRDLSVSTGGSTELIVVHHGEIDDVNPSGFEFSDSTFGVEYGEFFLIPWYSGSGQSRSFSYEANASGGMEKIVVSYNDGEPEFSITLGGLPAGIFFEKPAENAILGAIRCFCAGSEEIQIAVKTELSAPDSLFWGTIQPNAAAWSEIEIDDTIDNDSFFVTVVSSENSLGYDDSQSGAGLSFLNGTDLANYQVESNGEPFSLTGNWMIEAVFYKPIGPKLSVSETKLNFYGWRDELPILIENSGTDTLHWQIAENANWLEISENSGISVFETDTIFVRAIREVLTEDSSEILMIYSEQDTAFVTVNIEFYDEKQLIIFNGFPNPFARNSGKTITFPIHFPSQESYSATIYNILGQSIRTWNAIPASDGMNIALFDGFSNDGEKLPSGVYFLQIEQNNKFSTQKFIIIQ